jgi:beta-galactosidase/beta-glucuronidase
MNSQGYWPDGLYTPPTHEAMVYDLQVLKNVSMNMVRKHIKIEPDLWYRACDEMGLLVIQDMPSLRANDVMPTPPRTSTPSNVSSKVC